MTVRPIAILLTASVLTLGLAGAASGIAWNSAPDGAEAPTWADDRIPESESTVLMSTHGYAIPEFGDGVEWLGKEQPTFESMRGDVVVLHTWNASTTDGRAMERRVRVLLRPLGDEVHQIALHTPEEAEETHTKYERHSGRLPSVMAIDLVGSYCDELGLWKEPRIIVIGRDGAVRNAGVAMRELRDVVREALAETPGDTVVDALPPREDRVEEGEVEVVEDTGYPAHNRIQAADANNLQGQRGPALAVQEYVLGEAPELEGKVLMIEFWATWCGPCIAGIPHLNDLQNQFQNDLVIVGISSEQENVVRDKMRTDRRLDFGYTVAIDPQRRVQSVVGNRGIPHCIVMSSDGIVRWQGHPSSLDDETMSQIVAANKGGGGGGGVKRWVTD